jgi:hypothetical protein
LAPDSGDAPINILAHRYSHHGGIPSHTEFLASSKSIYIRVYQAKAARSINPRSSKEPIFSASA